MDPTARGISIELPFTLKEGWVLLILLTIVALSLLVYVLLRLAGPANDREGLLPATLRRLHEHFGWRIPLWVTLLAILTALVLLAAALLTLREFFNASLRLPPYDDDTRGEAIRNIGLVLVGLLGAPFLVWRSWVAAKQARIAEDSLFNDKINAAAEDLSARRQVTRVVTEEGGKETVLTEWEDDLVKRAAAIDRLEGLAQERPDVVPRVARMLSVYVRELSREIKPKDHPHVEWVHHMKKEVLTPDQARGVSEEDVTAEELRDWARTLKPARSDLEKAAQTLGRLKDIEGVVPDDVPIDLRGANLQGFDLRGLCFEKALMQEARLEGADLLSARMAGADLRLARMAGADLRLALLQGADLSAARLQGADLSWARLQGADLWEARLQGADFRLARLQGADLWEARFDENTNFAAAVVQYATVKSSGLSKSNVTQDQVSAMFGDGSVALPEGVVRPPHWPVSDLELPGFRDELLKWRADPASYVPPEPEP